MKKVALKISSFDDVENIIKMMSFDEERNYILREYRRTEKAIKILNDNPVEIKWFVINLDGYASDVRFLTKIKRNEYIIFNNYKNLLRKKKINRILNENS